MMFKGEMWKQKEEEEKKKEEEEEEEERNESFLGVNDHQDTKQTRNTERSSEYMYKKALLLVTRAISRVWKRGRVWRFQQIKNGPENVFLN